MLYTVTTRMKEWLTTKHWHKLFEVTLFMKGFNGVWETISGLTFLLLSKATLSHWFIKIARNELIEDPKDNVTNFIVHTLLDPTTSTKTFAAFYLLIHGILNLFLVIQLHRDKHWAYPTTIGVMAVFMLYQIYRISIHHSLILVAITTFDLFFIALTWHEYKHHVEKKQKPLEQSVENSPTA